jgi:hypothetical protein
VNEAYSFSLNFSFFFSFCLFRGGGGVGGGRVVSMCNIVCLKTIRLIKRYKYPDKCKLLLIAHVQGF